MLKMCSLLPYEHLLVKGARNTGLLGCYFVAKNVKNSRTDRRLIKGMGGGGIG